MTLTLLRSKTVLAVERKTTPFKRSCRRGSPAQLVSPLVWEGKEIGNHGEWAYRLNDAQLEGIDTALKSFQGRLGE